VLDARWAGCALRIRDHFKLLEPRPSLVVLREICLCLPRGHPRGRAEGTAVADEIRVSGHHRSLTGTEGIGNVTVLLKKSKNT
jgi:hypothetical protein